MKTLLPAILFFAGSLAMAGPLPDESIGHTSSWEDIGFQRFLDLTTFVNPCWRKGITTPDRPTPGAITLTFDDGPNPATTPMVLDVLKNRGLTATFMVEGQNVAGHEAILDRILREGHLIGSHSYDHPNFDVIPLPQQESQVDRARQAIGSYLSSEKYFRFPFGNATCESFDYVRDRGYHVVGWNIDTCDWAYADGVITDKERKPCEIKAGEESDFIGHAMRMIKASGGGILLMHDVHKHTAQSLDQLLETIQKSDYRFVELRDRAYYPNLNN